MKTIRYCVSMVQQDRDDFSAKMRQKILQYGINTYRQYIQTGINPTIEVFYAKPDSLGIINMPDDYEYYTKVGIIDNGRVFTLTLNRNMPLNRKWDTCGDEVKLNEDLDFKGTNYGFPFVGHYRAGNYVGELYGLGGGINAMGYYTEDRKLRRLQVTNIPLNKELVIEYVSSNITENTIIDDAAVNLIRYGIHQQLTLHDAQETQVRRDNMEREFYKALDHYTMTTSIPTVDEYLDLIYATSKSGIKR